MLYCVLSTVTWLIGHLLSADRLSDRVLWPLRPLSSPVQLRASVSGRARHRSHIIRFPPKTNNEEFLELTLLSNLAIRSNLCESMKWVLKDESNEFPWCSNFTLMHLSEIKTHICDAQISRMEILSELERLEMMSLF